MPKIQNGRQDFSQKRKVLDILAKLDILANIIAATLNFLHVEKGMIDGDF